MKPTLQTTSSNKKYRKINPLILRCLALLSLLHTNQLLADPSNYIKQLESEREKLKLETQVMKAQAQSAQTKIEQLKRRIELFYLQNKQLDQQISQEIQRYKNRTEALPNHENKMKNQ